MATKLNTRQHCSRTHHPDLIIIIVQFRSQFCPVKFSLAGICWICVIMDADGLTSQVICICAASSKVFSSTTIGCVRICIRCFLSFSNVFSLYSMCLYLYQRSISKGILCPHFLETLLHPREHKCEDTADCLITWRR